ncbi:50S ribosomal protein L29 [Pseudorhodoferax sp. Leaf267]|uniref:50S ribosomal protein L29 n=1 Tax=Pseudorhodoferax sp. Leaf267 TaxID=1736316 RepID=UPI0006FCBA36|nr:50S ribosomal protein L29 [Pseudorhodoferax sp. Leaf267]
MSKITESRKNLQAKDAAGLQAEVKELQKAHFGLRMQKGTQQLNNNASLRATRRDIARAKTILAQKLSAEQAAK